MTKRETVSGLLAMYCLCLNFFSLNYFAYQWNFNIEFTWEIVFSQDDFRGQQYPPPYKNSWLDQRPGKGLTSFKMREPPAHLPSIQYLAHLLTFQQPSHLPSFKHPAHLHSFKHPAHLPSFKHPAYDLSCLCSSLTSPCL